MAANTMSLSGLARRLVVDELFEEKAAKEATEQAQKDRIPFVKHLVDSELVSAIQEEQERLSLKIPILGYILEKSCIARFARTLSTTFAAGVPLVNALESVSGAAGNVVYRNAILEIKEAVEGGGQLNTSMKDTNVFPKMVIQIVAIGEESGSLDGMLDKAATYYEEMVDNMVDGLTSLMEPIIMSFLGVVIGGLIIAMYLPIFSMGDAIGGSGH
jgi:type IV pilus assembly protein PilC